MCDTRTVWTEWRRRHRLSQESHPALRSSNTQPRTSRVLAGSTHAYCSGGPHKLGNEWERIYSNGYSIGVHTGYSGKLTDSLCSPSLQLSDLTNHTALRMRVVWRRITYWQCQCQGTRHVTPYTFLCCWTVLISSSCLGMAKTTTVSLRRGNHTDTQWLAVAYTWRLVDMQLH